MLIKESRGRLKYSSSLIAVWMVIYNDIHRYFETILKHILFFIYVKNLETSQKNLKMSIMEIPDWLPHV